MADTVASDIKLDKKGKGSSNSISPTFISGTVGAVDVLIVAVVNVGVYFFYLGWDPLTFQPYFVAITVNLLVTAGVFYYTGLYKLETITAPFRQLHKIYLICGFVFLLLVGFAFALKVSVNFSRVWAFSSFFLETFLIILARVFSYKILQKLSASGKLVRRLAVYGAGEQGQRLAHLLMSRKEPWIKVTGIYDDRIDRITDVSLTGTLDDLINDVRDNRFDDVFIALPGFAEKRSLEVMNKLKVLPVHVWLSPDLFGFNFPRSKFHYIGDGSYLRILDKPISEWNYLLKEIEDRVISLMLLILVSPLMAVIGAAIKIDNPGPVLFRQNRYGFNNNLFSVFKFRTMIHDRPPDVGSAQATKEDLRVTRIGKFLRASSLDELPQLLNVFFGTMSLVGPRPLPIALVEENVPLIKGYHGRHRIKPGITAWAQVNGLRGETAVPGKMKKRVDHDIYYMENWSIIFDLKILVMTIGVVLNQKDAY